MVQRRLTAFVLATAALATVAGCADGAPQPVPAAINLYGNCAPFYPEAAFKAHAKGLTRVRFTIEPTGVLSNAEVVESSGPLPENKLLDEAALVALSRCPIRVGRDASGQPVGGQIEASYNWK